MDYILSVVLFAIASSITPGPNNVMVMTSGVNFGLRKSLPLLMGICVGFTIMLMLVGLGFGQLFTLYPKAILLIKILGTAYLLYLAWLIARSRDVDAQNTSVRPFGFIKGALFQWVNAKAWIIAVGAISAFTNAGDTYLWQNMVISITFLLFSFPCVGAWLIFGVVLQKYLNNPKFLRPFNYSMSLLLVLSVIPVLTDIFDSALAQ